MDISVFVNNDVVVRGMLRNKGSDIQRRDIKKKMVKEHHKKELEIILICVKNGEYSVKKAHEMILRFIKVCCKKGG